MDVVALDPFAGKGHHSMPLHRQVDLFTLLLEQLIDQAIMLVDDCGDLLWANSNARSMQDRWEIYQFLSSGRVFFDDQLKRVLLASGSYSSSEPLQQNLCRYSQLWCCARQ